MEPDSGILLEQAEDLLLAPSRLSCIPQRDRTDPILVEVLRTLFKMGKSGELMPQSLCCGVVNLQQQGAIALNDERFFFGIHSATIPSRFTPMRAGMGTPHLGDEPFPARARSHSLMELCGLPGQRFSLQRPRVFLKLSSSGIPHPESRSPDQSNGATLLHPGQHIHRYRSSRSS